MPPTTLPAKVARDGEDYAVHMAARLLTGSFTLYTDCAGTLGCCIDRHLAVGSANTRAHIWAKSFDVGGLDQAQFKKLPAHASMSDVRDGKLTAFERLGNHKSDALAKKGAGEVRLPADDIMLLRDFLALARSTLKFLGPS